MRRREIIRLIGSVAAWPFAARAQQPAMPVIGFLGSPSATEWIRFVTAFKRGLKETGYVEGENVIIEYRWAEGEYARLPALAADLVHRQVAVIFAAGSVAPVLAAKAATHTIPIVFANGANPVQFGLVDSFNRPGGNVTGVSFVVADLAPKMLGLLHELLPNVVFGALLVNPRNPNAESIAKNAQEAARGLALQLRVLNAATAQEIDATFTKLVRERAAFLLLGGDPFFLTRREQIVALAARHALPAIYYVREFVTSGGLMSYGTDVADAYHQAGAYTGKILKGARPADLPIEQSTKFEFVINLSAAKALGVTFPPGLLAIADDAIE
jgi:putative ABC transport system substrate-binding protein